MNKIAYISPRLIKLISKRSLPTRLLSTNADDEIIEIPKRIPRGPTDLLCALETTIARDPTAAHYKYHDDPFLIPKSNLSKRTYALAHESGRKAAHWVREQNPELFQHRECDPIIKNFYPKVVYNENSIVSEEDLRNCIKDVFVSDAIAVYHLLKGKGVDVSQQTLQDFLDLLCFYNNEDTLQDTFIEERWYRQSSKGKERQRKTWKDGALAEEIFISIENTSADAYSSLIQGMAKYYQVDRANQLFEEALAKKLTLNVEAYNAMLSVTHFLKEGNEMRWSFIVNTLTAMNTLKITPNLRTMNAVLEILSTMSSSRASRDSALKILREFKAIGVEASLASWYFILITFCKERGPVSYVLKDILPFIENRAHQIQDLRDTYFFVTAMDVCRNHLHDKELAQRVHNLLMHKNNYDLLGDSFKESVYYRHYFILMCECEPIDDFINNFYNKLVPHIYVPEPSVMMEVLKAVSLNGAVGYLPKLWSDLIIFDQTDRENALTLFLQIMVDNKPENTNADLLENYANIAWGVWTKIAEQNPSRITKLSFTGEMLSNIMTVMLWNGDFPKASLVLDKLDKDIHQVVGMPNISALSLFIDACIREKAPSKAMQCIEYCVDCGFPDAEQFALRLNDGMTLDDECLAKFTKLFGSQFITNVKVQI